MVAVRRTRRCVPPDRRRSAYGQTVVKGNCVQVEIAILVVHREQVANRLAGVRKPAKTIPATLLLPHRHHVGMSVVVAIEAPAIQMHIRVLNATSLERPQFLGQLIEGLQRVVRFDPTLVDRLACGTK